MNIQSELFSKLFILYNQVMIQKYKCELLYILVKEDVLKILAFNCTQGHQYEFLFIYYHH